MLKKCKPCEGKGCIQCKNKGYVNVVSARKRTVKIIIFPLKDTTDTSSNWHYGGSTHVI